MKKYHKQKMIANLYFNVMIFSFLASTIHISHQHLADAKIFPNDAVFSSVPDWKDNALLNSSSLLLSLGTPIVEEDLLANLPNANINPVFAKDYTSYPSETFDSTAEYEYSGMLLSHELEDSIKSLAETENIPYQILLTIGYQESAGNWNNNGVVSDTNDYGIFQINECNLAHIEENLGYSKEQILNDPIINTKACLFLLNNIINREDVTTLDDIFGMYNGWVHWKEKSQSLKYVEGCMEIMNTYFPNYEYQKNVTLK